MNEKRFLQGASLCVLLLALPLCASGTETSSDDVALFDNSKFVEHTRSYNDIALYIEANLRSDPVSMRYYLSDAPSEARWSGRARVLAWTYHQCENPDDQQWLARALQIASWVSHHQRFDRIAGSQAARETFEREGFPNVLGPAEVFDLLSLENALASLEEEVAQEVSLMIERGE